MQVERIDVSRDRVRPSLSEKHYMDFDRPRISYAWRVESDVISAPLEFQATEPFTYLQESDSPGLALWWRLAEATGWNKPTPRG
jgi:hypothetical protein